MECSIPFDELYQAGYQRASNFLFDNSPFIYPFLEWLISTKNSISPETKFQENKNAIKENISNWFSWLIFGKDPNEAISQLKIDAILKSQVCGLVWKPGTNAYRCRTCENDTSCAICLECFNAGDHIGHDCKF
eukprot:TRINITY_DN3463_c1_g1_i3.p1 TRINITY_DN3463_c1_g1~~TRINITY_DN3463_c1_g1_i3.p1  ORF type:complete len:133 (-),score=52.58 TRINITY_DN3463_c1_g1_i3:441-839(-)